ncbi:MAG TPA: SAM-dependent methyltransferase [Thermoplasmata archaeon]
MPPDDPAEAARLLGVAERLSAAADSEGFLPFDRFQEIALYASGVGYYDAPGRSLGLEGDFYTAAHVHPIFGATIADRIVREFDRLGAPPHFRVVEMGPGDGTLARTILPVAGPALQDRTRFEYVLVERSDSLRTRALRSIAADPWADRVRTASSLSAEDGMVGVVLGNEFLDAQPTRRLVRRAERWEEVGMRLDGARWSEAFRELVGSIPPPALPAGIAEGTVVEVSPAAEGFLREIGDTLHRGTAILLDYGFDEDDLVRGRPGGTLQATRGHRVLEDPLQSPGAADLSVFVNFSRIRSAASRSGLREIAYGSQAEALARWGFEDRFRGELSRSAGAEAEVRLRLAVKNLLFGFESFRALELRAAEAGADGTGPPADPERPAPGPT